MTISHVRFMSQQEAQQLTPKPEDAMISITNPGETAPLNGRWSRLLAVRCADAEYDESTIRSYGRMWPLSSLGFPDKSHALAIRSFLNQLPPSTTTVFVHCGAGVSRSAAVAKYVCKQYGLEFDPSYDRFNRTLFRLLINPAEFDSVIEECVGTKLSGWQRLVGAIKHRVLQS